MVLALPEEARKEIESRGFFVIEFKRLVIKYNQFFDKLCDDIARFVDAVIEFAKRIVNVVKDVFSELYEVLDREFSTLQNYPYSPVQKYKTVRILNKNMVIDRGCIWESTKRKPYLARSRC